MSGNTNFAMAASVFTMLIGHFSTDRKSGEECIYSSKLISSRSGRLLSRHETMHNAHGFRNVNALKRRDGVAGFVYQPHGCAIPTLTAGNTHQASLSLVPGWIPGHVSFFSCSLVSVRLSPWPFAAPILTLCDADWFTFLTKKCSYSLLLSQSHVRFAHVLGSLSLFH